MVQSIKAATCDPYKTEAPTRASLARTSESKTNPNRASELHQQVNNRSVTAAADLTKLWQKAKPILESQLKGAADLEHLKNYFGKVYQANKNAIDKFQKLITGGREPFHKLDIKEQVKLIGAVEFCTPNSREILDKVFKSLSSSEQEKLLSTLAFYQGTNRYQDLAVLSLSIKANEFLEGKLKAIFNQNPNFEFLGLGTSAAAIKVKNPGSDYVLKVPMYFDCGSSSIMDIADEARNLRETAKILGNNQRQFQKLAYDQSRQYLGSNEILATEFMPGVTLGSTMKEEDLLKYIKQGISDETVIEFINNFMKLNAAGVNMLDLDYQNTRYDSGSLAFIDFAMPSKVESKDLGKHLQDMEDLAKKYPASTCLRTLIQSVVMLESVKAKFLMERIDKLAGEHNINFSASRFEQLQRCLKKVISDDKGLLNYDSVKRGIKESLAIDSNNPLLLSPSAREYMLKLDQITDTWDRPKQGAWTGIKKILNSFNPFSWFKK